VRGAPSAEPPLPRLLLRLLSDELLLSSSESLPLSSATSSFTCSCTNRGLSFARARRK